MAALKVTIPENSQNIEGVARLKAPLDKVFQAYTTPHSLRSGGAEAIR